VETFDTHPPPPPPDRKLDTSGQSSPLPLLKAARMLREMKSGEVLLVVCTDPQSVRDFDAFARVGGLAELMDQQIADQLFTHLLRRH